MCVSVTSTHRSRPRQETQSPDVPFLWGQGRGRRRVLNLLCPPPLGWCFCEGFHTCPPILSNGGGHECLLKGKDHGVC